LGQLQFYAFNPFTASSISNFFSIALPGDPITASSTNSPAGQGATNAIDGTVSTKYLNFDITDTGFTVYPTITNVAVQALGLISAEDHPERDPASFVLYGSTNGSDFTLIASNTVPPFISTNSIESFSFANTNVYPIYQIVFPTVQNPATANSMQIAQVELLPYGDVTSTNDALDLILPAGASLNGIGPPGALLDRQVGGNSNKIVVLNDTSNVVALITPAAGVSMVKGFELIGGFDDALYPTREPSSVKLEGSENGTNFVTLAFVNPVEPVFDMQIQGFSVLGNTNAYKQYRVTFGPPLSGDIMQVGELRLFGIKPPNLSIASAGENLIFSWPASGFVLQQSTNLAGTNWAATAGPISIQNGQSQATAPKSAGATYYRLQAQ
jgi:hypothetical protein